MIITTIAVLSALVVAYCLGYSGGMRWERSDHRAREAAAAAARDRGAFVQVFTSSCGPIAAGSLAVMCPICNRPRAANASHACFAPKNPHRIPPHP